MQLTEDLQQLECEISGRVPALEMSVTRIVVSPAGAGSGGRATQTLHTPCGVKHELGE